MVGPVTPCVPFGKKGVQRTARPTSGRMRRPLTFQREKGSVPLARIPSLWAESGLSRRCVYLAISRNLTNSFAQLVFLFSRVWEFQQEWDSASERSRRPARGFSLIANQTGHSILPQRVPLPLAFLQA